MLPESLLLPLPVLKCGCAKGAGGVGSSISTELEGNLSPRGLVLGLAGARGGVAPWRGAISCWFPPPARFCYQLVVAGDLWVAPQPLGGVKAVVVNV